MVILNSCPIVVAQLDRGYGAEVPKFLIGESSVRGDEIFDWLFRCTRDNRLSVLADDLGMVISVPIGGTNQVAAWVEILVNRALAMVA